MTPEEEQGLRKILIEIEKQRAREMKRRFWIGFFLFQVAFILLCIRGDWRIAANVATMIISFQIMNECGPYLYKLKRKLFKP